MKLKRKSHLFIPQNTITKPTATKRAGPQLKAKEIEDEHMDAFEKEKGRLPRGNLKRNRKK